MSDTTTDLQPIKLCDLAKIVADFYHVEPRNLSSKSRRSSFVRPRQVFMYLARHYTQRSLSEIGMHIGWRDHTTVLHGVRVIAECVSGQRPDDGRGEEVAYLEKKLRERQEVAAA